MRYLGSFLLRVAFFAAIYVLAALVINPRQTGPWHLLRAPLVDDRTPKFKLLRIFAHERPVEGLVLGSSRSLTISPGVLDQLTGVRFFNLAVSGASIQVIADIYEEALRQGVHPKRILLGLDANSLMGRRKVEERQTQIAAGAPLARATQGFLDLRTMFNADFAGEMVMAGAFAAGALPAKEGNVFAADGGPASRPGNTAPPKPEVADRQALSSCVATMNAQFVRYDVVSELRFSELNGLVARARRDGASVAVFVTPFNPGAEEEMTRGTDFRTLWENARARLVRELDQPGVTLYDFSDAASFQADASGWHDCVHFNGPNADRLVRTMFATRQP